MTPRMHDDDPAWQSLSPLGTGLLGCETKCGGRTCGPDKCNGTCGTCPAGETCDLDLGACVGAPAVTLGEGAVLDTPHQGTDLFVSKAKLGVHAQHVQKLSIYVEKADGTLRLGIYDASGSNGAPGKLLAATEPFAASAGWNTRPVRSLVALPPGDYWLAYRASSASLETRKTTSSGESMAAASSDDLPAKWPTGTAMPGHFSVSATVAP